MAGKKLNPELAGLSRAVVLIDSKYGGEGRFVKPLLRIARTNLELFKGVPAAKGAEILCRTLNKLAEEKKNGRNYQEREVLTEALEWAAQTTEKRR